MKLLNATAMERAAHTRSTAARFGQGEMLDDAADRYFASAMRACLGASFAAGELREMADPTNAVLAAIEQAEHGGVDDDMEVQ